MVERGVQPISPGSTLVPGVVVGRLAVEMVRQAVCLLVVDSTRTELPGTPQRLDVLVVVVLVVLLLVVLEAMPTTKPTAAEVQVPRVSTPTDPLVRDTGSKAAVAVAALGPAMAVPDRSAAAAAELEQWVPGERAERATSW